MEPQRAGSLDMCPGGGVTWLIDRHVRLSGTETFFDMRSIPGTATPIAGSYVRSLTLLTLGLGL